MLGEPSIDRSALLSVVCDAYQLPARSLAFLPLGFDSACYVLDCAGGRRFILKLWPNRPAEGPDAGRHYATLTLTRLLHDRGLLPRVSYPLPTRTGTLWTHFAGMPLAVYPLLPGRTAPSPLPLPLRLDLARAMAQLHGATPALVAALSPDDWFAIPEEATVLRNLAAVAAIEEPDRPGMQALRGLVLPRQAEVLTQRARLRELQQVVLSLPGPLVVCHRDLTAGNLLVDDDGQLSILDWDGAALAPPEHDLWSVVDADAGDVLEAYLQAGGVRELHVEQFAFYLLRRYLRDMLARLERLVTTSPWERDDAVDAELVRGMEAYGFTCWTRLAATLAVLSAVLA
jgi:spectinomycin phosphotransferase